MKRTFAIIVMICTLVVGFQVASLDVASAKNAKICAFQSVQSASWTDYEDKLTIKCFANKYGVSVSSSLYIARRESGFDNRAINHFSDARGLYQHIYRYWPGRVSHFRHALRRWNVKNGHWYNPRTQAVITMKMVLNQGGWCPAWC